MDGEVPYQETLQRVRVWWERMGFCADGRPGVDRPNGSKAVRLRPLQRLKSRGNPEFRWYRGNFFALSILLRAFLFGGIENAARITEGV